MKNAETLGSIAVVKDVDLPTEYRVIEPISQQNFDEVYKEVFG